MKVVDRLLASPMRSSSASVLLLEGARGAGKTFLAKHLLHPGADYNHADLSLPTVLEAAQVDPDSWLASLGQKAVIDEAQLLPGLQLAIKRVVDSPEFAGQYILTGSASLPQDELGGSSPLTRRSESFQLRPLTRWELAGGKGSVVDHLFGADLNPLTTEALTHETLREILSRGGFPSFVASDRYITTSEILRRVPGDIDATLTDQLLPSERFEASVARTLFDSMMKSPGGILTYEGFARTLGIDRRTVARYTDLLRRLHLIYWVPNLASRGKIDDAPARSKVYPIDTSFSVYEALKYSTQETIAPELFGQLLEALVIGELTASSSWSQVRPRAYYWRSPKQRHEVDLVLIDASGNRIGIEVKSSTHVGLPDIRGLQALQKEAPDKFRRGFVVYPGEQLQQMSDSVWSLPLNAIFEPGILGDLMDKVPSMPTVEKTSEVTHKLQQSLGVTEIAAPKTVSDASLFLSYTHKDDEYLGGGIVQFAKDLTSTYETLTGKEINVFVDKENIPWGQRWSQHLLESLDQTAFLLCAVSPRYLVSETCQEELSRFRASAATDKARKVLPLVAIDLGHVDPDNLTLQTLRSLQFIEFDRSLDQILDSDDSKEYGRFVKKVARELVDAVHSYQSEKTGPKASAPIAVIPAPPLDLVTAMTQVESISVAIQQEMIVYGNALEEMGAAFQGMTLSASPTPKEAQASLKKLAKQVDAPTRKLNRAVSSISTHYAQFDAAVEAMVSFAEVGTAEMKESLIGSLTTTSASMQIPNLEQLQSLLTMMSLMSSDLRPTAEAIAGAIDLLKTIQTSMNTWKARLER